MVNELLVDTSNESFKTYFNKAQSMMISYYSRVRILVLSKLDTDKGIRSIYQRTLSSEF